jgi:hypothetical protein
MNGKPTKILAGPILLAMVTLAAAIPAAAEEAAPSRALEAILDRLGDESPAVFSGAMVDLEAWLRRKVGDRRSLLVAADDGASAVRKAGVKKALERLAGAEKAEATEAAARSGAPLSLLVHLRAASVEFSVQGPESRKVLEKWGMSDPETVSVLLEGYLGHLDSDIARVARELTLGLRDFVRWRPVLKSFDALGIPSISGAKRVLMSENERARLPEMPALPGKTRVCAWLLPEGRQRGQFLDDDGCLRSGPRGTMDDFVTTFDIWAYKHPEESDAPQGGALQLWRAVLYARWKFELGRLYDGVACLRAASDIASASWPTDSMEALAARVLRTGADFLLRQAKEAQPRESVASIMWKRLGALPFEDCRKVALPELERLKRVEEGEKRWGLVRTLADADALPLGERVDYWIWRVLERESGLLAEGKPASFIEALSGEGPDCGEPMAGLARLPWEAVPFLIEALDDATLTAQWVGDRRVRVSDAVRFALSNHLGGRAVPRTWDQRANTGWRDETEKVEEVKSRASAAWTRYSGMTAEGRAWSMWRDAGCNASDWVLERDPVLCLDKSWAQVTALEEGTRRREIQTKKLRNALSRAPEQKLQALLSTTTGELRDVVQSALDERGQDR